MKKILGWVLVAVLIAAVPFAWARSYRLNKDDMNFSGHVKFTGEIDGASALIFDGATENAYETTLSVTDPTSDNTITLPDATGTVVLGGGYSLSSSVGYTTGTGFSVSAADMARYSTFLCDVTGIGQSASAAIGPGDGTGVTVVLAAPTAATHGKHITFVNTAGTTDLFLYPALPIDTSTGVTDNIVLDSAGDAITIVPVYNSAVSYYIQSYRVH